MAIYLIDKIKPKNSGSFAMVDSADVEMSDGSRLEAFLEALVAGIQIEVDYDTELAFDTEEIVVEPNEVILIPNDSDDTGDDETLTGTSAILGVAILGQAILGKS